MHRPIAIVTLFVLLTPAAGKPQTSMESDAAAFKDVPELTAGFRLLYEQKFLEGRAKFTEWASQHPEDPFGYVAVAASYLFEELYRQGVLTSDFFLDNNKFLKGIEGKPDPARMKSFLEATRRARELAKVRLKTNPRDQEALFALTLAAGMESDADTILEKKPLDGLKRVKEANAHAKLLLSERPDAADAFVALGIANYTIGSLSAGFRTLLWFGGVHGDKKLGMQQVGKTAENGRYLKPFGKIMLALAARREKQNALAQRLLRELSEEFPSSPLYAAEYAKAMGRPIPAQLEP
jgi:hypothetical protein